MSDRHQLGSDSCIAARDRNCGEIDSLDSQECKIIARVPGQKLLDLKEPMVRRQNSCSNSIRFILNMKVGHDDTRAIDDETCAL